MTRTSQGVSLIEVLVTLAIVAIALLGMAGLQARALSVQQDAFHRRHAAELVAQLAERMRANQLGFAAGGYALRFDAGEPAPETTRACAPPCSSAQVALRDLDEWRIELRRRMPGAAAYVGWDATDRSGVDVLLAWPEPQAAGFDPACSVPVADVPQPATGRRCYRTRVFP